jgi:hypothetical protein
VVGLDIHDVSVIARQPEEIEARHGGQNFRYCASGTPFRST